MEFMSKVFNLDDAGPFDFWYRTRGIDQTPRACGEDHSWLVAETYEYEIFDDTAWNEYD